MGAGRLWPKFRGLLNNYLDAIQDVHAAAKGLEGVERGIGTEKLAIEAVNIAGLADLLDGRRNIADSIDNFLGTGSCLAQEDTEVVIGIGIYLGTDIEAQGYARTREIIACGANTLGVVAREVDLLLLE